MTSGHTLGAILTTFVSGFIASSWIGWPGIFYFFGVASIIPALLLAIYGADSPQVHPSISPDERAFIANSFREVKNFTEFKVQYYTKCCVEGFSVLFYIVAWEVKGYNSAWRVRRLQLGSARKKVTTRLGA